MGFLRLCNPPASSAVPSTSRLPSFWVFTIEKGKRIGLWPAIGKRVRPGFRILIDEYPDRIVAVRYLFSTAKVVQTEYTAKEKRKKNCFSISVLRCRLPYPPSSRTRAKINIVTSPQCLPRHENILSELTSVNSFACIHAQFSAFTYQARQGEAVACAQSRLPLAPCGGTTPQRH